MRKIVEEFKNFLLSYNNFTIILNYLMQYYDFGKFVFLDQSQVIKKYYVN